MVDLLFKRQGDLEWIFFTSFDDETQARQMLAWNEQNAKNIGSNTQFMLGGKHEDRCSSEKATRINRNSPETGHSDKISVPDKHKNVPKRHNHTDIKKDNKTQRKPTKNKSKQAPRLPKKDIRRKKRV